MLLQIGIDMKQKRWLVNDPDGALLMRHDLVADVLGRAALRPLDVLLDEPLQLRIALELLYDRCVAEAAIPHRHHRHIGVGVHHVAIASGCRRRRLVRLTLGETALPRRDNDTRAKPLHIPFPRRRESLVEIVEIEDQIAFRRREPAEIH